MRIRAKAPSTGSTLRQGSRLVRLVRRVLSVTSRVRLASAGPSIARTHGADLGGAKGKPGDAAMRSVSAARGVRGVTERTPALAFRASSPPVKGTRARSNGRGRPALLPLLAATLGALAPFALPAVALAAAPSAITEAATNIHADQAQLNGSLNPNGEETAYWFEYGTTAAYGNRTPGILPSPPEFPEGASEAEREAIQQAYEQAYQKALETGLPAGSGTDSFPVSVSVGGLAPETTYHFRLLAENPSGKSTGLDQTFTTPPAPQPQSCPNEAARSQQHTGFLADCRAYELVSPAAKNGSEIIGETTRIQAAAGYDPALPAAIAFPSFGGFADVRGTGVATEYMAQRDAVPGTQGWSTHAITPQQEPLSYLAASQSNEPFYTGELSPELTQGIFRAWSPLTDAPNVNEVINLYRRPDLRSAGQGSYELMTDSVEPLPALAPGGDYQFRKPTFAGASADFRHILFESRLNLTSDATGDNSKLYKSDDGVVRLVSNGNGLCPSGTTPDAPCAIAGISAAEYWRTPRIISADGSRVSFAAPIVSQSNHAGVDSTPGIASRLYQLDDQGTETRADDATIEISASEKQNPDPTLAAIYQTASVDGSRVFFISGEQLTESSPGGGLYMWERSSTDEVQALSVDATGGIFTLTAHAQPTAGTGTLTNGSTEVSNVTGSFSVGQTISGPGIAPGTTVAAAFAGGLSLSAPASLDAADVALRASIDATTGPLPANASTAQVEAALESLEVIGSGNVSVSGSPSAYEVTFVGALAGVNVAELTADGSALTGGATSASVTTTTAVHNLTFIAPGMLGVTGASEDGHRVYFPSDSQILYLWKDTAPNPGLFFIGAVPGGSARDLVNGPTNNAFFSGRVTPDGRHFAFLSGNGQDLAPGYQHGTGVNGCIFNCLELYVYSADTSTPTRPDVVCASCDLSNPVAAFATHIEESVGIGTAQRAAHLARNLSDDGRRAFFSTNEPLAPEDTNGAYDAYEYDLETGSFHLLSTGTDPADSFFIEANGNGDDAYFMTRSRLVGWDEDGAYDLYDARVDGGLPEPPPPPHAPCDGETCKNASPAVPGPPQVGSGNQGSGNPKPPRCARNRHPVKVKGKLRCHHHHSHRRHRNANANRRAGR